MTVLSLLDDRQRLEVAERAIVAAIHDMDSAGRGAQFNAGCAASWAAVMMTADIIRAGLSAGIRVADAEFQAIDKGIERANIFLSYWGHQSVTTKADLLKSVDPEFRGTVEALENVNTAREAFNKIKFNPPPNIARPLNLLLDLAISMTDDTILMLQAGKTGNRAQQTADRGIKNAQAQLQGIRKKIRRINDQIDIELNRKVVA
jgi:hypothetical protein